MLQIKNRKNILYITVGLLLIIALGIRVYKAHGKDTLFLDENLSVILSNYTGLGWSEIIPDKEEPYTGKELKELFFKDINTLENISMDVRSLRRTTRDVHPNIYYSLLRASFWQCDTTNLNHVLIRGIGLNLILFIIGFTFLLKLLRRFTDNPILIGTILIVAFFNPISIGNSIFLRCYQLQETLFILMAYMLVCLYQYLYSQPSKDREQKKEIIFAVLLALISSLTVLSGYFSIPFVGLLWLAALLFILKKNELLSLRIPMLLGSGILTLLLMYLIYPESINAILGNRGLVVINIFSDTFKQKIIELWTFIVANYIGSAAFILSIMLIIYGAFNSNKQTKRLYELPIIIISTIALVWIIFTWIIAPFNVLRYIAAGIPIISLILIVPLKNIKATRIKNVFCVAIATLSIINVSTNKSIYWDKIDTSLYKTDNTPLILYKIYSPWGQTVMIPFFTDDRNIEVAYSLESLLSKTNKYEEVYIVCPNDVQEITDTFSDNFSIIPYTIFSETVWLKGYKIKAKPETTN